MEIDGTRGVVSAVRFDANGNVVAETEDEWDNADLGDLLTVEGREPTGRLGALVGITVVAGLVGSALVGIWTIIRALLRL